MTTIDTHVTSAPASAGSGLACVAEWVTTFADGTVTQWRGDFMVSRGQIRRFEVHRVG